MYIHIHTHIQHTYIHTHMHTCSALHCITLHCVGLHCNTQPYLPFHYSTLPCVLSQYSGCITLWYSALHYSLVHCIRVQCIAFNYVHMIWVICLYICMSSFRSQSLAKAGDLFSISLHATNDEYNAANKGCTS